MKRSKSIADCGAPLLFIALLLVLWELIVSGERCLSGFCLVHYRY
ncbi:MAG: hypothetical protein RQM95_04495 [Syntrophaceticus schinkii]